MRNIRRGLLLALLPCCFLSTPAVAETARGAFGVHLKIESACSAQQKQNRYSPVMVTCQPGTTPYQTEVYQFGSDNAGKGSGEGPGLMGGGSAMLDKQPPAAIQQMMYFSQTLYRIVAVTF